MTPIQASYPTEQTPRHERSSEASYANELAKIYSTSDNQHTKIKDKLACEGKEKNCRHTK